MSKYLNIALIVIVLGLALSFIIKPAKKGLTPMSSTRSSTQPSPTPSIKSPQFKKAEQVIKAGKSYTATLHTSAGDIVIELSQDTPVTTNNFIFLAQEHFYDGVTFHRVIPGFMIQGGDPLGTGSGGPGYQFADEFKGAQTFAQPYLLAMANSGPNTNGSQFFITVAPTTWLDKKHTIFGTVVEGKAVVDKIIAVKTGPNNRPLEPVVITSIEIDE